MDGSFWRFLLWFFENNGPLAGLVVAQSIALVALYRQNQRLDREKSQYMEQLLEASHRRLQDLIEEKEQYDELASNLDRTTRLLIDAFRSRSPEGS